MKPYVPYITPVKANDLKQNIGAKYGLAQHDILITLSYQNPSKYYGEIVAKANFCEDIFFSELKRKRLQMDRISIA